MEKQSIRELIEKFRRRASTLRSLAYVVLVIIATTLGGGVYLFVIAGELVSMQAANAQKEIFAEMTEVLEATSPQVQDFARALAVTAAATEASTRELEDSIRLFGSAANEVILTAKAIRANEALTEEGQQRVASFLDGLDNENTVEAINAVAEDLPGITGNYYAATEEVRRAAETLPQLTANLLQLSKVDVNTSLLISTLATRIGALLVLVFLVQILINLYRYNIRVSAFFDARADALELYRDSQIPREDLVSLMNNLSPDNLDFGASPASPAQQAVDLARDIIAQRPKPD